MKEFLFFLLLSSHLFGFNPFENSEFVDENIDEDYEEDDKENEIFRFPAGVNLICWEQINCLNGITNVFQFSYPEAQNFVLIVGREDVYVGHDSRINSPRVSDEVIKQIKCAIRAQSPDIFPRS